MHCLQCKEGKFQGQWILFYSSPSNNLLRHFGKLSPHLDHPFLDFVNY